MFGKKLSLCKQHKRVQRKNNDVYVLSSLKYAINCGEVRVFFAKGVEMHMFHGFLAKNMCAY